MTTSHTTFAASTTTKAAPLGAPLLARPVYAGPTGSPPLRATGLVMPSGRRVLHRICGLAGSTDRASCHARTWDALAPDSVAVGMSPADSIVGRKGGLRSVNAPGSRWRWAPLQHSRCSTDLIQARRTHSGNSTTVMSAECSEKPFRMMPARWPCGRRVCRSSGKSKTLTTKVAVLVWRPSMGFGGLDVEAQP